MNTEVILEDESDVIWQRHTTSKGPIMLYLLILMVSCCFVTVSRLTLCYPMNSSKPGFPVLHYLLKFAQTHIHWVGHSIQPYHPLLPPSPPALSLSQHRGIYKWVSSSHSGLSIGASTSASVLPVGIQGWFPLWLTGLISLLLKGLSRVFPSTTIWKHLFFSAFFMVQLSYP